ncbi:TetR/AcrR family transcriptional regulator [Pseudorhodoplanes sp.]|uniref:TetR/AcrR family transcriptional regulator n=1 Tax=Pseudorhodoplanes sp. TaxID=1934341 RepID=UPI003D0CE972
MAQIKKDDRRAAILSASYQLFMKHGYHRTTLRQIAETAGVSLANVYIYFPSKYQIVFELYDPWMAARLEQLMSEASAISDKRQRLRHIVLTLWRDIPAAQNGFARNIMQALSTQSVDDGYDPTMIAWIEKQITDLIAGCLPSRRRPLLEDGRIGHVMMMAFDGFVINQGLNPNAACTEDIADSLCAFLLGRPADQRPGIKVRTIKTAGRSQIAKVNLPRRP